MKKIAFIMQCLTGGGAERTVANLSLELSKSYDVYIILFDGKRVTYPHNATIIDIALPSKSGRFAKVINAIRRINAVRKIKKEYQFDSVVSFMFGANIVNVLSKRKEQVITSARNYLSVYGLSKIKLFRERFVARRSDRIVAISEMVKNDLVENFGLPEEKITTIYNPCEVEKVLSLAEKTPPLEFDRSCFYFITVGRLVHQKGQWNLLKSFKLLSEKCDDARLIVLGSGDLENKLRAMTRDLKIEDRVIFGGFADNPFSYVKRADVFVLTSLHEGLGNVILEAMACGKPVISADCFAGPREILAPNTDLKAKAKDVEKCQYGILVPELPSHEDYSSDYSEEHSILMSAMYEIYTKQELRENYARLSLDRIEAFLPEKIASEWIALLG